jgi:hypothetical protein
VGSDLRERRRGQRSRPVEVDGRGCEHSVEHVIGLELERQRRDDEQRIDRFGLGVFELGPVELVFAELGDDEPVVSGALRR